MRSLRRKIAASLLVDLLETPAEQAWVGMSTMMREAEGPGVYSRELIPGFDSTFGEDILWKPPQEAAEERSEAKNEKKRTKKLLTQLKKISEAFGGHPWEYESGGRQPYQDTYSARRQRDNETGVDIAWNQTGESFYNPSKSPEPPLLNQDNYNTDTTHHYRQ